LDRRIRELGWKKERAITTPIRPLDKNRTYWRQIADKNGISFSTFHSRIRRGWSDQDAATKQTQTQEQNRLAALHATNHARVHPEKYLRLAELNGISYPTFHRRVKVSGWDYERAATEPLWSRQQIGRLGAQRLREREGDWGAQIFGKRG